ncbi:conserved hypothetical protein [Culex quinquefasciatus]|uniref:Uncharacterized protein n=1 Tax=Culex quinquefasciatus TaxID=7176 RepID=B0W7Y3_CULQU|nr:conserved hypothetical protein [Culex quinquefasciatus]|eukprot:XP_001844817.1 conserved hypothetical protein [Culex quinquefasciatus]
MPTCIRLNLIAHALGIVRTFHEEIKFAVCRFKLTQPVQDAAQFEKLFALEHIDDNQIADETQEDKVDIGLNWQQQQSQLNQIEQSLLKIEAKQNALIENLRKISLLSVLMSNVSEEN